MNYYDKYIKYKTKYTELLNKIGGYSMESDEEIMNVQEFCLNLTRSEDKLTYFVAEENITKFESFTSKSKKLICAIYLLCVDTSVEINTTDERLPRYFTLFYQNVVSDKVKYLMEDIYKCSIEYFILEDDKFMETTQSYLFYYSNLINFSILMCKLKFNPNKNRNDSINRSNITFSSVLIETLINALTCSYQYVLIFYQTFLQEFDTEFYNTISSNGQNRYDDLQRDINETNLIYLSLNHVRGETFVRFEYSKILVSIVNPKKVVHFKNTIFWNIYHDFHTHHQIQKKSQLGPIHKSNFRRLVNLLKSEHRLPLILFVQYFMYESQTFYVHPFSLQLMMKRLHFQKIIQGRYQLYYVDGRDLKIIKEFIELLLNENIINFNCDPADSTCRDIYFTKDNNHLPNTEKSEIAIKCEIIVNEDAFSALSDIIEIDE